MKKYRFIPNSKETFDRDYNAFVGECLLLGSFEPKVALAFKLIKDEAMRKAGRIPVILDHSPIMKALDDEEKL